MNVVMEEEQEMDATERSRKECNRHDGPMVAAFCSFAAWFSPSITFQSSKYLPLAPENQDFLLWRCGGRIHQP